jgi:hypothetical protein
MTGKLTCINEYWGNSCLASKSTVVSWISSAPVLTQIKMHVVPQR